MHAISSPDFPFNRPPAEQRGLDIVAFVAAGARIIDDGLIFYFIPHEISIRAPFATRSASRTTSLVAVSKRKEPLVH